MASEKPLLGKRVKTYNGAHVIPGMYTSQVAIYAAGASYQWLRDNICQEELANAKKMRKSVYYLMDKKASESPPGSNNLIFVPGLMGGGTIHPNPNIRGAFLGLALSYKKEDLIRSVMEGVAFDLRMVLDEFKKMGVDANEIRIVGGGSESKLWRQIFSDIYNTKIIVTNIGQETAALGAAAVAAVGTGLWKDFSVIDEITEVLDINTPDKKNIKKYEKMLDVYKFIAEKISDIGEKMASYRMSTFSESHLLSLYHLMSGQPIHHQTEVWWFNGRLNYPVSLRGDPVVPGSLQVNIVIYSFLKFFFALQHSPSFSLISEYFYLLFPIPRGHFF